MIKQCLVICIFLFIVACSASLPRATPGKKTPIYSTSHPVPDNLPVELIGDVTVTHGHGCGGFGAVGTLQGVHILLRNKAIEQKADAALITKTSKPHISGIVMLINIGL